ncbi:hypothetical protein [Duncaniella freteri]|nr:hypothetical protein [Duncaniella freteri]
MVALAAIAGNIGGDRVVLWGCEPNSEGTAGGWLCIRKDQERAGG